MTTDEQTTKLDREAISAARRTAERNMIGVLLDMRDRLSRGVDSARQSVDRAREDLAKDWLAKLSGRRRRANAETVSAAAALVKGCLLTLERLDEALAQFGVHEIDCRGRIFDPHSMRAVEIEETTQEAEGRVLDVVRSGFEWNGELFRPSEVRVARRLSASREDRPDG